MSVNKVILVGNVGKDPEIRHLDTGVAVANFPLATSESYTAKNGEKVTTTEWHNIVMYRKLAEIAGEYLKKGRPVYIEGRLQTRKWQTKEGQDRYSTEIIADNMQMLGGKDSSPASNNNNQEFNQTTPRAEKSESPPTPAASSFDEFEDDIPF